MSDPDQAQMAHIENLLDHYETFRQEPCPTSSISSPKPPVVSADKPWPKRDWTRKQSTSIRTPSVEMICKRPGCNSTEIIEDVNEGSVVCIQCGMIQSMSVFESADTNAIYHEGVSRTVVHRYSRIVYLRAILLGLQGETRVDLDLEEWITLQLYFQQEDTQSAPKNAALVKKAIRHLKLPYRLMRHAHTLAWQLWKISLPNLDVQETRDVFRQFRVFENAWDREPLGSSIRKGRKKFPSYSVVWNYCCLELKYVHLVDLLPPLHNPKLRDSQMTLIKQLVHKNRHQ